MNFKRYFAEKKERKKTITLLQRIIRNQEIILNERIREWTHKIEEFDQEKIYFYQTNDFEEAKAISLSFNKIKEVIKWTPPIILILRKNHLIKIDSLLKKKSENKESDQEKKRILSNK